MCANLRSKSHTDKLGSTWARTRSSLHHFNDACNTLPKALPSKAELANSLSTIPLNNPTRPRVSEHATAFQFRKLISTPQSTAAAFASLQDRLTRPPTTPSPDFETAARQCVKFLGPNWDKTYERHCVNTVPTLSANLEKVSLADSPLDPASFLRIVTGEQAPLPIPSSRKFNCFPDGGKTRSVTIASILQLQLAPLSSTLYDALVRTGAILKGDCSPLKLKGMKSCKGEEFISGDYSASTDNFISENTATLIAALKATSTRIPAALFDLMASFMENPTITWKDLAFQATSGQLMGDRPSFSLLCLTNLTGVFLGIGPKETRARTKSGLIKINGDDILMRLPPSLRENWIASLPIAGLKIEPVKTLIHKTVMTLNSTFYLARVKRIPISVFFLRSSSIFGEVSIPNHLPPAYRPAAEAHVRLVRIADNVKHLCQSSPRTLALTATLLKAFPGKALGKHLAIPLPSFPTQAVPPNWRRAIKAVSRLTSIGKFRPPCAPLPPVVRRAMGKPTTPKAILDNSLINQIVGFRRTRTDPPLPILHKPDPAGFTLLGQWVPFRPSLTAVRCAPRAGLGYKPPKDTHLTVEPPPPLLSILPRFVRACSG